VADPAPFAALGAAGILLARSVTAGRIPPAWIVQGPDEEAGEAFALELAAWLVARDATEREHVGARIRADAHPDVHRVRRDKPTVISVAALAEHLERAHATPREGLRQVFVVTPADALEPEGVARYLKTLEEPPDRTVFVLVTSRPDRLPTAVLSRCQSLVVPPLESAALVAALVADDTEPARAASAAHLAGGSLARARRLLDLDLLPAIERFLEQLLDPAPRVASAIAGLDAALKAAKAASDDVPGHELVQEVVRAVSVLLRDLIAARAHPLADAWRAAGVDEEAALALFRDWSDLAAAAAVHVAPSAVFGEMATRLRRACTRRPGTT
jgi:hypothetical protein